MTAFIIREKASASSARDGAKIEAKNLTGAKRAASRAQVFQGTAVTIENESGEILTVKEGKAWKDNPVAELYK
jgi:hypothetical protein